MSIIQNRIDELKEFLENFPPSEEDTPAQKLRKNAMIKEIEHLEKLPH